MWSVSVKYLKTGTMKFDHITPVLKSLHWLPVEKIIDFKVLPLVYRALQPVSSSSADSKALGIMLLVLPTRDSGMLCQVLLQGANLKTHLFKSTFN